MGLGLGLGTELVVESGPRMPAGRPDISEEECLMAGVATFWILFELN